VKPGIDYIKLNDEQLKKLQNEMLQLLVEVDRICRKNNIQYFLSHGTLLGAVRHKGYIPWDDDVDIEMLREDYERFCKACESDLNTSKFFLQNQQTDKNYNWVYGKLKLQNTSYVRAGQEHLKLKDGIFLDIFPLDHISSSMSKQKFVLFMCKMFRKILWAPVGKKTLENKYSRMLFKVLSFIPRTVTIRMNDFITRLDNKKNTSFLISNNLFDGHVYKREWYTESIDVDFEGHTFMASKEYHHILTLLYGDYMKLPPVEKREGHCYPTQIKFTDGYEMKLLK